MSFNNNSIDDDEADFYDEYVENDQDEYPDEYDDGVEELEEYEEEEEFVEAEEGPDVSNQEHENNDADGIQDNDDDDDDSFQSDEEEHGYVKRYNHDMKMQKLMQQQEQQQNQHIKAVPSSTFIKMTSSHSPLSLRHQFSSNSQDPIKAPANSGGLMTTRTVGFCESNFEFGFMPVNSDAASASSSSLSHLNQNDQRVSTAAVWKWMNIDEDDDDDKNRLRERNHVVLPHHQTPSCLFSQNGQQTRQNPFLQNSHHHVIADERTVSENPNQDRISSNNFHLFVESCLLAAIRQYPSELCFFSQATNRWLLMLEGDEDVTRMMMSMMSMMTTDNNKNRHSVSSSSSLSPLELMNHQPSLSMMKRILLFADEISSLTIQCEGLKTFRVSNSSSSAFLFLEILYQAIAQVGLEVVSNIKMWATRRQYDDRDEKNNAENKIKFPSSSSSSASSQLLCLFKLIEHDLLPQTRAVKGMMELLNKLKDDSALHSIINPTTNDGDENNNTVDEKDFIAAEAMSKTNNAIIIVRHFTGHCESLLLLSNCSSPSSPSSSPNWIYKSVLTIVLTNCFLSVTAYPATEYYEKSDKEKSSSSLDAILMIPSSSANHSSSSFSNVSPHQLQLEPLFEELKLIKHRILSSRESVSDNDHRLHQQQQYQKLIRCAVFEVLSGSDSRKHGSEKKDLEITALQQDQADLSTNHKRTKHRTFALNPSSAFSSPPLLCIDQFCRFVFISSSQSNSQNSNRHYQHEDLIPVQLDDSNNENSDENTEFSTSNLKTTFSEWFTTHVFKPILQHQLNRVRYELCCKLIYGEGYIHQKTNGKQNTISIKNKIRTSFTMINASLQLIKKIPLFQAWSDLQETLVDGIISTLQPQFASSVGGGFVFTSSSSSFTKMRLLLSASQSAGNATASSSSNSSSLPLLIITNIQKWVQEVVDRNALDENRSLIEKRDEPHLVQVFWGNNFDILNNNFNNVNFNSALHQKDLTGTQLIRTIANLRLDIGFTHQHPVLQSVIDLLDQKLRRSKNEDQDENATIAVGGDHQEGIRDEKEKRKSAPSSIFSSSLSNIFITLLSLSTATRHLQLELKSVSQGNAAPPKTTTRNEKVTKDGVPKPASLTSSSASSSTVKERQRMHFRILHTCHFTLDCILRFITTELQRVTNKLEKDLEEELNGHHHHLQNQNEQEEAGTTTTHNKSGARRKMMTLDRLMTIFEEFLYEVRGLAVLIASDDNINNNHRNGKDMAEKKVDQQRSTALPVSSTSSSIVNAISTHVATLCAVACDSTSRQQQQQQQHNVNLEGGNPRLQSDSAAFISSSSTSMHTLLDRTLQRVDLACRSLVAVLRGLRIETDDPEMEKRTSALLSTLTFNSFF